MDRIPVIIGVGQSIHRDDDDWAGAEPLQLMLEATRMVYDDCAVDVTADIDSIDMLHIQAWRYDDGPALLAQRLGCAPVRGTSYPVGGETPLRVLDTVA